MNKYQKALNSLRKEYLNSESRECDILQELVDKETHEYPIALLPDIKEEDRSIYYLCPHCKEVLPYDYEYDDCVIKEKRCQECGGLLDWNNEEDYEVTYENNCCIILDKRST